LVRNGGSPRQGCRNGNGATAVSNLGVIGPVFSRWHAVKVVSMHDMDVAMIKENAMMNQVAAIL